MADDREVREASIRGEMVAEITDILDNSMKKDGDTIEWKSVTLYDRGTRKTVTCTCTRDAHIASDVLAKLNGDIVKVKIGVVLMDKKYRIYSIELVGGK